MPAMKKLECLQCDFTKDESYRETLFKTLKNIEVIDKLNREGDEVDTTFNEDDEDDLDEGKLFYK